MNGPLEEEFYVRQPPRFEVHGNEFMFLWSETKE